MNKEETLLKEKRIYLVTETDRYCYYICKGQSNDTYEIIYDKYVDTYSCTCKNVRHTDCYHIKGCRLLREE